jgi:alkylation response protein AidB-like acyl-CoA dehydrogenase
MDLRLSDELEAFRAEVRAFFREQMQPEHVRPHADPLDLTGLDETFERRLLQRAGERGFLGIHLPREYGGGGRPLAYKAVFDFEAAYWAAPAIDTPITLVAPQILEHGSEAQRRELLPRMLRGELLAAIAYTEEGAGSDLSAIETRVRRDGDDYVIDGRKTLVTGGHKADLVCLIARSDPQAKPRRGMSIFLVDARLPGVREIRRPTMNAWTLSDFVFEGVRVGPEALLGRWNEGWAQLAAALKGERSGMFHLGWATRNLEELVRCVRDGARLFAPRDVARSRIAGLRAELAVGLRFSLRVMQQQAQGEARAEDASMAKLYSTELLQRMAQTATELLGPAGTLLPGSPAAPVDGRFTYEYLERVHPTIGAGTSEMQLNTIAQAGLGLPRA